MAWPSLSGPPGISARRERASAAVATGAGIGRATLYKYFPDVETILVAWHERQVSGHLEHLARIRDQASPGRRLEAVLEAYALMTHDRPHGTE
ncbi:MAG: TetR/AcrR family transcriptional regulator, partial [Roseiarcus sp.]|uniref:TetR/AcrR family transcriptional regulator n=1 Tax=Roseiarcus sp. TaxID=1969460 RepID=UPI003C4F0BA3